jgi:hypothetical protein
MGKLGGTRTLVLLAGLAIFAGAGCSRSGKKSTPTTSTSAASSTSTSAPEPSTAAVSTTSAPSASSTTAPAESTTTGAQSGVRITGFTVSPASPVCNGPTMIQLTWTAIGANTVALSIDGRAFASYGGGAQSHLEYYACDGHPHTYLLTAHGASGSGTASKIVTSTSG